MQKTGSALPDASELKHHELFLDGLAGKDVATTHASRPAGRQPAPAANAAH
jgi:hypothetical protein